MEKDDTIGFRIPAALKRALEAAADADNRSLGQFCTLALMKFMEDRGEWPTKRAGGTGASRTRLRTASRAKARR